MNRFVANFPHTLSGEEGFSASAELTDGHVATVKVEGFNERLLSLTTRFQDSIRDQLRPNVPFVVPPFHQGLEATRTYFGHFLDGFFGDAIGLLRERQEQERLGMEEPTEALKAFGLSDRQAENARQTW